MKTLIRLTAIALALSTSLYAQADSSTSSASSAGSESSGSVSDSVHSSSTSSSTAAKVADRDYHIVNVAKVTDKAGMARVTLQANDADLRVMLDIPLATVDKEQLRKGDSVHAQDRVYGIEFEHGDTRAAFYLALNDTWIDDLAAHKVSL